MEDKLTIEQCKKALSTFQSENSQIGLAISTIINAYDELDVLLNNVLFWYDGHCLSCIMSNKYGFCKLDIKNTNHCYNNNYCYYRRDLDKIKKKYSDSNE